MLFSSRLYHISNTESNHMAYNSLPMKIPVGSIKEIERAEANLEEAINKASSGAVALGKRTTKPTARTGKTASDNQVSRALGEKKKLNSEQAALKKQAALEKKQRENAIKDAEKEEDVRLFPVNDQVKRSLLFEEPVPPSMMPKTNELMSDDEQPESDDDQPVGNIADLDLVHDEDENNDDENHDEDEDRTATHEPSISDFKNPNTERFLKFLLHVFNPAPVSCSPGGSSSEAKVYAKPLQGAEGQKMIRLKKNHGLMVSKASKAALLVDFKSRKSSTVFLRKTLEEIYGAEQLSRMTAMGRLKDSLGISKQDLNAIYDFVTEYSDGDLSWDDFKVTINKKCSSKKTLSNKKSSSTKSSSLNKSKGGGTRAPPS